MSPDDSLKIEIVTVGPYRLTETEATCGEVAISYSRLTFSCIHSLSRSQNDSELTAAMENFCPPVSSTFRPAATLYLRVSLVRNLISPIKLLLCVFLDFLRGSS